MTAVPKVAITSPAALLAFLRGVERRAVVLVELQTGTMSAAQAALPAAIRIFGAEAVDCPFAEWSIRFLEFAVWCPSAASAASYRATLAKRVGVLASHGSRRSACTAVANRCWPG